MRTSAELWHLQQAVRVLRGGGIVLHATEGVWGLACDPFNAQAVQRVLQIKRRTAAKGLIIIAASECAFAEELAMLPATARNAVSASWPGALTWILPSSRFPDWVTGARRQIAARVPGHAQSRALCRAYAGPLVSTSANRSGQPPARSSIQARGRFSRAGVSLYQLPGEIAGTRGPSEIRSLAGETLRPPDWRLR